MPYGELLDDGRIQPHRFRRRDLEAYMALAQSRLSDSDLAGMSTDVKYMLAYDAIHSAARAVMAAEGYRATHQPGHHATMFEFLERVADGRWQPQAEQFDDARKKRNRAAYERFGLISETEAGQLLEAARVFLAEVHEWLQTRDMLPKE